MNITFAFGITLALSILEAVVIFGLAADNDENKKDNKRLKRLVEEYREESISWRKTAYHYRHEAEKAQRNSSQKGIAFTSDTAKEMVKFAMTQAHPDKPNGSNERFIRYREIYEKVCK